MKKADVPIQLAELQGLTANDIELRKQQFGMNVLPRARRDDVDPGVVEESQQAASGDCAEVDDQHAWHGA